MDIGDGVTKVTFLANVAKCELAVNVGGLPYPVGLHGLNAESGWPPTWQHFMDINRITHR
jgi:hypothetical protein